MALLAVIAIVIVSFVGGIRCDYYTSVVGLEDLLQTEVLLIDYLETYMLEANSAQHDIEVIFEEIDENLLEIFTHEDPSKFYENPIDAFKTIRRFAADWPKLADAAAGTTFEMAYHTYMDVLVKDELKPTADDLMGACKGLVRLQETYALKTEQIAQGILKDEKVSSEMQSGDCFELGRYLMDIQQYARAAEWLMQSKVRLAKEDVLAENKTTTFANVTNVRILEHLTPVLSLLGNNKLASKFNEELLASEPNNKFGLDNAPLYKLNLVGERRQTGLVHEMDLTELQTEAVNDTRQMLYEKTCRGELHRTPKEERELRCRYAHNNVPFCFIAPFKVEELNFDPYVAQYHEVIYDEEITNIISIANQTVERSKVGDVSNSVFSDVRTSKNTWLWFNQHAFMKNLAVRLADITGLSLESGEALQVANYGIGGHYGPHHDFMTKIEPNFGDRGNRILTALFYINTVELGGATAFPYLRIAVPPIRRSLLVWFNLHDSSEPDYRTLHAGCPVLKGSKWICNEWLHEAGQEFRRPCGLTTSGHKSLEYKDKV